MKLSRTTVLLLLLVSALTQAQGWREAYEEALGHLQAQRWTDARHAFQRASALRPEDFAGQTMMPGAVTEPRPWRDGSPYSPNFGAAVAGYRAALAMTEDAPRTELLRQAARELETLLHKGQGSRETVFFLANVYRELGDAPNQQNLDRRVRAGMRLNWKVDAALVTPEERATIATLAFAATAAAPPAAAPVAPPAAPPAAAQQTPPAAPPAAAQPAPPPRRHPTDPAPPPRPDVAPRPGVPPGPVPEGQGLLAVAPVATKFALVIGNSTSMLPDGEVPFAGSDANLIRDLLIEAAGYPAANVEILLDVTAAQITEAARELAARMPDDATVTLFFTGVGANLDGRDYLAGVDTQSLTDVTTMVAKTDIYRLFMARGARIFAFFQANRPVVDGRYFGQEVPMVGAISQMQATIPGERVFGITRGGRTNGLFAQAMGDVLSEFRSNSIPILEFGWQVFFAIRRGGTPGTGLGSVQTPTLPVITNMGADARF
jgi:hypothetical protein